MKIARVKVAVGAKSKAKSKAKTARAPKIMKSRITRSKPSKPHFGCIFWIRHPAVKYIEMIKVAIVTLSHLSDDTSFSLMTILSHIRERYILTGTIRQIHARLRAALKRGVATGVLVHSEETGFGGTFNLADQKPCKRRLCTGPQHERP